MDVYMRAKFQDSSTILTSIRQGAIYSPHLKTNTKKPIQIMANDICYLVIGCFDWKIGAFQ